MSEGHGEKRSRKGAQAIAALINLPTVRAAAESVGIDEKTLRAWLRNPKFSARFNAELRAIVAAVRGQSVAGAVDAVATLRRLLTCGHPATEARAAEALLSFVHRGVEVLDIQDRLAEVEARLAAGGKL